MTDNVTELKLPHFSFKDGNIVFTYGDAGAVWEMDIPTATVSELFVGFECHFKGMSVDAVYFDIQNKTLFVNHQAAEHENMRTVEIPLTDNEEALRLYRTFLSALAERAAKLLKHPVNKVAELKTLKG